MKNNERVHQLLGRWFDYVGCFALLCLALTGCSPHNQTVSESALVLAENGIARAVIVALPEAGKPARFAAEELKMYLDKAAGASFPIVDSMPKSGPAILIGDSVETRKLGISVADLKRDGFILKRVGDFIVIAGRDDKDFDVRACAEKADWHRQSIPECATAFGAYEFLERIAGVRWYFPGQHGEFVPAKKRICVSELDLKEEPALVVTYPFNVTQMSEKSPAFADYTQIGITHRDATYWTLRMRRATDFIPMGHMPQVQQFGARFGEKHPEWFAMGKDGTRQNTKPYSDCICYSNPEVTAEIIKDIDAFFSGRPASERGLKQWCADVASGDYYSLLPYDNMGEGCLCPNCKALWNMNTQEKGGINCGLLSNLIWGHMAEVGRAIKDKHPGKKLVCLAYNDYREIPQTVKLPDNILAGCTAIMRAPGSWAEKRQIDEVKGWKEFSGQKVYIGDYYNLKEVNTKVIVGVPQTEFKAMGHFFNVLKDNIVGVMHENYFKHAFQQHLDSYLFYRLRWRPDLDVVALESDYCRNMYGPAAEIIRKFLDEAEDLWLTRITIPRKCWGGGAYMDIDAVCATELWEEIYNAEEMGKIRTWMSAAKEKTKGTEYEKRVNFFIKWYFEPLENAFLAYQKQKKEFAELKKSQVILKVDYFSSPPVIDGRPDDNVWKLAPNDRVEKMVANDPAKESKEAEVITSVTLGWDNTNLYILVTCEEPDIKNITASRRKSDDFGICEEDSVEIFINSSDQGKRLCHIVVNAEGVIADRLVAGFDVTWNSDAKIATFVYDHPEQGKWYVEMAVPLAKLPMNGPPKPADQWAANICRNRPKKPAGGTCKSYTWSPFVQGAYAQPDKFGTLEFSSQERR